MSDSPLQFVHPEFVHVLWVWALAVLGLALLERRGSDALDRFVSSVLQDRLVDRPSRWRRWARIALLGVAGFSMGIALMQPQWGSRFVSTPRVGAKIMIALDVSKSMLADDAKPSRLERAKAEISDLLSYLENDHVGLIAFAGRATVLSPMTPDKSFLRLSLDRTGPHVVSRGGTNLAEPILRAVASMGEAGPAQRALILITDGEDHDSFALDAAKTAAEAGIKIITIGFGDESGSRIYLRDPKTGARTVLRDAEGREVESRLDGDLLREIALMTDGAFVPAGTGVLDLASIYDAHIAPLTRSQLDQGGRTIRDEAFQFFVLLAIVCLVAAASIVSAPGGRGEHRGMSERSSRRISVATTATITAIITAAAMTLAIAFVLVSASPVEARSIEIESDETASDRAAAGDSSAGTGAGTGVVDGEEANPVKGDPRAIFNRGNEKLGAGDPTAAAALLRAARRDATDDVLLRYAATYNLGFAASARADAMETEDAEQALAALYEAADWFREAVAARPDESDPRHNLDVTLRRALMLSDKIASENERELDAELDALIEVQRTRVAQTAGLLEAVVRSGELHVAETLRPRFRDSATQQRLLRTDANLLGERVARDIERHAALPERDRSPEDILKASQLEALLVHLDSAIDRMGQTRRQLRQRRAERAYRRAASALGDLKRARDQLRGPVPQIDILLAEVGRLARATSLLANLGSSRNSAPGTPSLTTNPSVPAYLTRESVEAESDRVKQRVSELAARLTAAAEQARLAQPSSGLAGLGSNSSRAPSPGGFDASDAGERDAQGAAFQEAAPLVISATLAMERVTAAIGEGQYDSALRDEMNTGEALAAARERFFDLRQLLNVVYSDENLIAEIAGTDDPDLLNERAEGGEVAARLAAIQSQNRQRGLRLGDLLEREREDRITELEVEAESATNARPTSGADSDSVELERQRFKRAGQLLLLASEAMGQTTEALGHGSVKGDPDWPRVIDAASRATEHLDGIRTLFFSIAEHIRKLALDESDLLDRTQDVIALSVTERPRATEAEKTRVLDAEEIQEAHDLADSAGTQAVAESRAESRGPETLARALVLATDQGQLESRGGQIADALFVQAEEMGQSQTEEAPPNEVAERDRIRKAAEHVAVAQLAMAEASQSLGAKSAPLGPVPEAQTRAVDELRAALELLSPPPPPEQPESDSQRDESQSNDRSEEGDDGEASNGGESGELDESDRPGEESLDDPSQLLQGVRDRDAQRRRERDRKEQRRRAEPVEKDW